MVEEINTSDIFKCYCREQVKSYNVDVMITVVFHGKQGTHCLTSFIVFKLKIK